MTGRSCLKTILSHTEKDVNILWGEEIIFNTDKLECSEIMIEGLLLEKMSWLQYRVMLYTTSDRSMMYYQE